MSSEKTNQGSILLPQQEEILRRQMITEMSPGPIVHDMQVLLDRLHGEGVPVAGAHRMLPMGLLGELNEHMAAPFRVTMKRPQLRSFPNLQGLFMVARAAGLVTVREGKTAQLLVDSEVLEQWRAMNDVEKYFTLLEAWLAYSDPEVIGERTGGLSQDFVFDVANLFYQIPKAGQKFSEARRTEGGRYLMWGTLYNMALLEMFGLIDVVQGKPIPGKGWVPAAVKRRPFGEALLALLELPDSNRYAPKSLLASLAASLGLTGDEGEEEDDDLDEDEEEEKDGDGEELEDPDEEDDEDDEEEEDDEDEEEGESGPFWGANVRPAPANGPAALSRLPEDSADCAPALPRRRVRVQSRGGHG